MTWCFFLETIQMQLNICSSLQAMARYVCQEVHCLSLTGGLFAGWQDLICSYLMKNFSIINLSCFAVKKTGSLIIDQIGFVRYLLSSPTRTHMCAHTEGGSQFLYQLPSSWILNVSLRISLLMHFISIIMLILVHVRGHTLVLLNLSVWCFLV